MGRHVLTSGEYHYTAKSYYQIPTKVSIKQFNTLEAERQSATSRIKKEMSRKIQVCNTESRKVQKTEYQVQARLESVQN